MSWGKFIATAGLFGAYIVKDTIPDEKIEILRDNCNNLCDRAMIDFLLSTEIRVGELVRLNIDDIDFSERECNTIPFV